MKMENSDAQECVTKTCNKCFEVKSLECFPIHSSSGNRRGTCSVCVSLYKKKWRVENLVKVKRQIKEWKTKNYEQVKQHNRKWNSINKDKVSQISRDWAKKNKERMNELSSMHSKKHSDCLSDRYVVKIISKRIVIDRGLITIDLIYAKRRQIMINRAIKKQKQIIKGILNAK